MSSCSHCGAAPLALASTTVAHAQGIEPDPWHHSPLESAVCVSEICHGIVECARQRRVRLCRLGPVTVLGSSRLLGGRNRDDPELHRAWLARGGWLAVPSCGYGCDGAAWTVPRWCSCNRHGLLGVSGTDHSRLAGRHVVCRRRR